MDHPFRTAAVGGFNRQDVLNYLETVTREAAEKQADLERSLDEAREAAGKQLEELTALREQAETREQELNELKENLAQREQELAEARARADGNAEKLESMEKENAELSTQVAGLKPGAEAYDSIKERTAGLELEAHHRAKMVEEQSKEQARQLRRQMEVWMQKVEREYDSLRSQVEATVAHAADQLTRAGENLDKVSAFLDEQDVELKSLTCAYIQSDPDRVNPPMPLSED